MKLEVVKIVRKGKFHTRVETSDGKQLVIDCSDGVVPVVGQVLDVEVPDIDSGAELRPLASGDPFPEMVDSITR